MSRGTIAAALCSLTLVLAGLRLFTYHEPLERDITTYAVIAHELLQGRVLYADLWDHKPPAVHVSFALSEWLFGYGPAAVYALGLTTAAFTMLAVFAAAHALAGARAGLAAAVFYTLVSGDLALQANQPNVEAFLNATLTAASALLLGAAPVLTRYRTIAIGLLFALASLYKPHAVLAAALLGVALVWGSRDRDERGAAGRDFGLMLSIGLSAWLTLALWFSARGSLAALHDAVITYNRAYAGSTLINLVRGLQPKWLTPLASPTLLPLTLTAILGSFLALRPLRSRNALLTLAWIVSTYVMVAAPGKFWPHYYQLWLPLLVTLAAVGLVRTCRRPAALALAAAVMVCILGATQLPSYRLTPEEWSEHKYGPVFVDTRAAAHALDALLEPGETFYAWGAESGLYFYTRRSPPTGVVFNFPLLDGLLAQPLTDRVLHDLERARPELVVAYRDPASDPSPHAILDWVRDDYVPFGDAAPDFALWARRGGRIEQAIDAR